MREIILNIFLIIENDTVTGFKAISYNRDGSDEEKISFLKSRAKLDFEKAESFGAPVSKSGHYMTYGRFSKLEKQGMHFRLFEEIFKDMKAPQNPLVCVTPLYNGELIAE